MTPFRSGVAAWRRWSGQALEERDPVRDRRELALILAAAAFVFVNAVAYSLVRESAVTWPHLFAPLVWLGGVLGAHLVLRTMLPRRDPFLLPLFALLAGWGLLLQDRLAPNFLGRQTVWLALATPAMLFVAVAPRTLQPLMRYRYSLLVGGLFLLAFSLVFGVNPSGSGAALWLPVPFPYWGTVYFQPSEALKLLLVLFLASYFTEQEPLYRYRKAMSDGKRSTLQRHLPFLGPLLLMWGFTLLLLVWQQDLGAAALFFVVFIILLYLATGEKVYVLSGLLLLLLAGVIAFFAFDAVVAPRVLSWINPWPNVSDRAYQIVQGLYAQAAGGLFGQGIGQGFPDFIPVVHSDFVLAAIAEEWGLLGSLAIVACFGVLAVRGLRTAVLSIRGRQPAFFHAYLAAGLVALFSMQAFLIMGGVTRLLPLTGITLPFVSYGGSSMLISSIGIGLLLYLSARADSVTSSPPADAALARRLGRLGVLFLGIFAAVALALTYWSVARADVLLAREDNPRLIESVRRVQRGRILDINGAVLAESRTVDGILGRVYPSPESSPVVGYFSLRYGAVGIESAFNDFLSGRGDGFWPEALRRLLHVPPQGADVRLTLDAGLQQRAAELMSERDVTGGLVLLELVQIGGEPVAEVRAMTSAPGFDPNRIDAEFEALSSDPRSPLLNRAAQGHYQPGLILQPMITASAIDAGVVAMDDPLVEPFLPVVINQQVLRCARPRDEADRTQYTWGDMAALRCPAPLHTLGDRLGAQQLNEIFARFGLTRPPDVPISVNGAEASIADAGLAAIGEELLIVSPLQAALALGAIAGDGRLPAPRLVEALAGEDGQWGVQPPGSPAFGQVSVSPAAAAAVREGWPGDGDISSFTVSVLSGPDNQRNVWYLGFAPTTSPRYVVALLVEDETNLALAGRIGVNLLAAAMETGN